MIWKLLTILLLFAVAYLYYRVELHESRIASLRLKYVGLKSLWRKLEDRITNLNTGGPDA